MVLRQHTFSRVANLAAVPICAAYLVPIWLETRFTIPIWGILATLAVVVLSIRASRAAVVCYSDRIIVRGFFWSRSIPLRAVTRILDEDHVASVRWKSSTGSSRSTPIAAFSPALFSSSALPFPAVLRHNDRQIAALRRWVRLHR